MLLFLAAVLPALVLVYFIFRKDKYKKEPPSQLLKGFGYGALSALCSSLISLPLMYLGLYTTDPQTAGESIRLAVFGAGIPEELTKFFFLCLLLRKNPWYDERVDGIVYAVCVGMGFAALENIEYLVANYANWVQVSTVRAFVSIPGHFFFAVTMGYFLSKAKFASPAKSRLNTALAIICPIILHSAFDAFLMVSQYAALAGGALSLFAGLYIYMAVASKRRFENLLAEDGKDLGI